MDKRALIEKFINNACNHEEASAAIALLRKEPELIDEVLTKSEWDAIQRNNLSSSLLKAQIWARIEEQTKKRPVVKLATPFLAAASVILLIGLISLLYFRWEDGSVTNRSLDMRENAAKKQQQVANSTDKAQNILLADGSTVILYPQSVIAYDSDFVTGRNIVLTGRATFNVVKDPDRPFTVFSGGYSTTALGTEFMVDNSTPVINIQLYTGKVVVKTVVEVSKFADTYLSPGEQCFIDSHADQIRVARMEGADKTTDLMVESIKSKTASSSPTLQFYKTPLPNIFDSLESKFSTEIDYEARDIGQMYFTGSFSSDASVARILEIIATVNGLQVTNQAGVFRVGKPAVLLQKDEDTKEVPTNTVTEGELSYTKAPLSTVFGDLQVIYNTNITYNQADIYNMYFTGAISTNDDIANILNLITKMNRLNVKKEANGFRVLK